jgi:hypothetical protein
MLYKDLERLRSPVQTAFPATAGVEGRNGSLVFSAPAARDVPYYKISEYHGLNLLNPS